MNKYFFETDRCSFHNKNSIDPVIHICGNPDQLKRLMPLSKENMNTFWSLAAKNIDGIALHPVSGAIGFSLSKYDQIIKDLNDKTEDFCKQIVG